MSPNYERFVAESVSIFLISEHLAKLQARRRVHFLRLLAVWWPCVQRVRDSHLILAGNCAK